MNVTVRSVPVFNSGAHTKLLYCQTEGKFFWCEWQNGQWIFDWVNDAYAIGQIQCGWHVMNVPNLKDFVTNKES